jgi:hypothetical protein
MISLGEDGSTAAGMTFNWERSETPVVVRAKPRKKYPLCQEGARACPPEDCGGIWGYPDFVEAVQNPDHEHHEELLEWVGARFDPEEFDPSKATKAMR